ncbi:MAG: hypothetical protein ACPF9D_05055, partial [Owenweeksia sp.]
SLFLWLSSLIAAVSFLLLGFLGAPYLAFYGKDMVEDQLSAGEQKMLLEGFAMGLRALGIMVVITSSLLFLFRKKLRNRTYAGIFAGLMLMSLVLASLIATHFGK